MRVLRLRAQNFRLLRDIDVELDPGINVLLGDNAAGKTSLLETLYTAAHGRPVGGVYEDVCGPSGLAWVVRVRGCIQDDRPASELEVSFRSRRHFQRIDGVDCTRADLARLLPMATLNPQAHALVGEGPGQRRRFLDWGMFHVEQQFMGIWRRYRRALRQRNAVLRSGGSRAQLISWNEELAVSGETLHTCRQNHLNLIEPSMLTMLERLVGDTEWRLGLDGGWNAERNLIDVLAETEDADRRAGATQSGPHRAELWIKRNGSEARRRISRGEEKLLAAALLLVQSQHIGTVTAIPVMLLVDDFTSELDAAAQRRLMEVLLESRSQVVITALSAGEVLAKNSDTAMFHVEHGCVTRVVN